MKLIMSINESGITGSEKLQFDVYNESDVPVSLIEKYFDRRGYYLEKVMAGQIYRNQVHARKSRIRISGSVLIRIKQMRSAMYEQF